MKHCSARRLPAPAAVTALLFWSVIAATIPATAQQGAPDSGDAEALCLDTTKPAAERIEGCTKALDTELRETSARRAFALANRAMVAKAKGENEKAYADVREAIAIDSTSVFAHETLADFFKEDDNCKEALGEYETVLSLQANRAPVAMAKAICLATLDDRAGAQVALDQAIKIDPANAQGVAMSALELKIAMFVIGGEPEKAIQSLDAALALDMSRADLHFSRGVAWSQHGNQEFALRDFNNAIARAEKRFAQVAVTARAMKARILEQRGDLEAALVEYDQAIQLNDKLARSYIDRAGILVKLGRPERALDDYNAAVRIEPEAARPYFARGGYYRDVEQYAAAVQDFDKAITLDPSDASLLAARGLVQFFKGDFEAAADDLGRFIERRPDPYAALIWYVSSLRARRPDAAVRSRMSDIAAKQQSKSWPLPILDFYLGRSDLASLRVAAEKAKQSCEADFYVGQWEILRTNHGAAQKAFASAVEECPKTFTEYQGAKIELGRLR